MDDIVESTLEQLFPGAENSSTDELMKIKELSAQMIANSQKITRRIFDDMVQEYNLQQTLDAHHYLKEKKMLVKKLSTINQQIFKYDEEDKIQRMAEYLQETDQISQVVDFHKSKLKGSN